MLTPKIQIFDFSKIITYKIRNFQVIQKNGIYVFDIHTNNKHVDSRLCARRVRTCVRLSRPAACANEPEGSVLQERAV